MATEAENGAAGASPGDPGEAAAWADVERAWDDEERHRAYLLRFADLQGLAVAGGRYRAALDARPGDPIALRFRDEILRRATALALSAAPRALPSRTRAWRAARWAAAVLAVALAALSALLALRLLSAAGGSP